LASRLVEAGSDRSSLLDTRHPLISLLPGEERDRDLPPLVIVALVVVPIATLLMIGSFGGFFKKAAAEIGTWTTSRPKTCEDCEAPTKQTHYFDETYKGRFPGESKYLGASCLEAPLGQAFVSFQGRCLLLEPVKSKAVYAYTNNDQHIGLAAPNGEFDTDSGGRCRRALGCLLDRLSASFEDCITGRAHFLWVPAAEFKRKWWDLDPESLERRRLATISLCGECAFTRVLQGVEQNATRLDSVQPPRTQTVLMFSGEA